MVLGGGLSGKYSDGLVVEGTAGGDAGLRGVVTMLRGGLLEARWVEGGWLGVRRWKGEGREVKCMEMCMMFLSMVVWQPV